MAVLSAYKGRTTQAILGLSLAVAVQAHAQTPYAGYGKQPALVSDWQVEQEKRVKALANYLSQKPIAYRWFTDFPFGLTSGAPYIVLKLLPRIAPEQWGSKDNFLDVVGLFNDERNAGYPIARGFGWTGLARDDVNGAVDFAALSCGACHVGRVRLDDGGFRYLDGGVNTQFNLVQYRVRVVNTIKKMTGDAATPEDKVKRATAAVLEALDKAHMEDKNFFYQEFALGSRRFDADYETNQIDLFKKSAPAIMQNFLLRADLELSSLLDLINKNYKGFEAPMAQGFGGMADATGVTSSFVFAAAKAQGKQVDPETDLPPTAAITDFMAVWEQGKRLAHWSQDHTRLVDGGGQWNGNIPIPIFRNLAAELTLGLGADTDLRVAAFAEDLLRDLPAPAYPFPVDLELAKKGESLFQESCAACHKPHNGGVYDMGTDLGRARVVSEALAQGARALFTGICPPSRTVKMPPNGTPLNPCAEFENVSLENKAEFAMADPKTHDGYNALPLGGVWAEAPYLHNGSVPTLFHLLVPSERPKVFMKGRLDYDKKLVGYAWDIGQAPGLEAGYRFDTAAFSALSNTGHDKNIMEGNKTLKLDWSDDKASAMAIVEYLKTR